jgi:hypothetical protein
VAGQEQLGGDLGERQVGGQHRQQAQLGGSQRRRPGGAGTALLRQPGPKRLGLLGEVSQAGAAPEQLIDLPHERSGTGQVGKREVHAGELEPGLNGEVGGA